MNTAIENVGMIESSQLLESQRTRRSLLKILSAVAILVGVSAHSYADDDDTNPRQIQLIQSSVVDQVDPRSGNLIIRQRDEFLPGNGGLDIEVWRNYNMTSTSTGLKSTQNESYRWAELGPGWVLTAAPKISYRNRFAVVNNKETYYRSTFDDMCLGATPSTYLDSNPRPLLQLPNGDQEEIYVSNFTGYTKSNWKVSCVSGAVKAWSPKGVVYDFGLYSERHIGLHINIGDEVIPNSDSGPGLLPYPSESYLVAKTAQDTSGNTLTYNYIQLGTPYKPWTMSSDMYLMPKDNTIPLTCCNDNPSRASEVEIPTYILSSIVSSDGRSVSFNYDSTTARLKSMQDSAGRTWSYSFLTPDTNNSRSLSKVTMPNGDNWSFGYAPGAWQDVSYGGTEVPYLARKLTSITNPTGGVITYGYGEYNYTDKIVSSYGSVSVRVQGERVVSRTLSTGESWNYTFTRGVNGAYDTTTIVAPEGTSTYKYMGAAYNINLTGSTSIYQNYAWEIGQLMSMTDPLGNTETYTWQQRLMTTFPVYVRDTGLIQDKESWAPVPGSKVIVRDGGSYSVSYSNYDSYGNPGTKIETGPNGESRTTTYTYYNDPDKWIIGLILSESSPGRSVNRTFDSNGRLTTYSLNGNVQSFTYDAAGNLSTKTLPRGETYSYSNYKGGIAQTEVHPEGTSITRTIDEAGNISSQKNSDGFTTTYKYDPLNRLSQEVKSRGNAKTIVYGLNSKVVTRGDLVESTQYDAFDRPVSVNLGGITIAYKYDAYGRVVFKSQPNDTIGTTTQYDAIGRVVKTINSDGTASNVSYGLSSKTVVDERGNSTTYKYRSYSDPSQQFLIQVNAPISSESIVVTRDSQDLVTSISQNSVTRTYGYDSNNFLISVSNPETGVTTYGRDKEGNMTSKQIGVSGVTTYVYDLLNRLSSTTYPGGADTITYSYNGSGKLLSANRSSGNRAFLYDGNNNVISDSVSKDGNVLQTLYSYDGNDKLASITYPYSGHVVQITNDALGRPLSVGGYVSDVQYWPSGLIKQINYANGTVAAYSQNSRLWPSAFGVASSSGVALLASSYGYDASGNLVSISDQVDSTLSRVLSYDAMNQLVGANGFWGTGTISYDGSSNIIEQTYGGSGLNYAYDSQNRLASVAGKLTSNVTYDAYGNMASFAGRTFKYDDVPNLICSSCDNPAIATSYTYDGMNSRLTVQKVNSFAYDVFDLSGKQLSEISVSPSPKLTEYIYLGDKRIAERVSP